jgi:hypothetical protein
VADAIPTGVAPGQLPGAVAARFLPTADAAPTLAGPEVTECPVRSRSGGRRAVVLWATTPAEAAQLRARAELAAQLAPATSGNVAIRAFEPPAAPETCETDPWLVAEPGPADPVQLRLKNGDVPAPVDALRLLSAVAECDAACARLGLPLIDVYRSAMSVAGRHVVVDPVPLGADADAATQRVDLTRALGGDSPAFARVAATIPPRLDVAGVATWAAALNAHVGRIAPGGAALGPSGERFHRSPAGRAAARRPRTLLDGVRAVAWAAGAAALGAALCTLLGTEVVAASFLVGVGFVAIAVGVFILGS